jgi:hypothetical protein
MSMNWLIAAGIVVAVVLVGLVMLLTQRPGKKP